MYAWLYGIGDISYIVGDVYMYTGVNGTDMFTYARWNSLKRRRTGMDKKFKHRSRMLMAIVVMFVMIATGAVPAVSYADDTKYDGYLDTNAMRGLPLYVSPQGSRDYGEVAYCFNFNKHFPNERGSSANKFSHYIKKEGTAANFVAMAETPRLDESLSGDAQSEDFRAKVLRVLYNGYPMDKAGLKAKYGADDWELRFATQCAVWYFTDSKAIDASGTDSGAVMQIRQELVKLAETTVLPDNFKLDIYEPQNVTDSKGYQNLLSTGIYYGTDVDKPVEPEKTEVSISKTAVGSSSQLSGAELKIVEGDSESGTTVESWTSTSAVKKVSLKAGTYTLVEVSAPSDYKIADPITFRVTDKGSVEIKNGNTWTAAAGSTVHMEDEEEAPEKVSIGVSKTWNDNNDQDGLRANSITVRLLADNEKTNKTVVLSEANQWKGTFSDLDKTGANDKDIEYTVEEDAVAGYKSEVTGTAERGFTIENSHTTEKTTVAGSKTWSDRGDNDGKRPESITVRLHKDGQEIASKTVTEKDNWSWEFTGLDKYRDKGTEVVYTITEDAVDGYTSEVNNYDIENKYAPEKTSVSVTKAWSDSNDQDGVRPNDIRVYLVADNEQTEKSIVLSEGNNWSGEFTDLEKYKDKKEIRYTVKEEAVDKYDTVVTGTAERGFTIENSHTPEKTAVAGSKTWSDRGDNDGKRPESITVRLHKDGQEIASKTVTEKDNWSWEFTGLDKYRDKGTEVVYTITEDAVDGYTSEVNNYDIENKYAPEKTSVSVTKAWNDSNDRDKKRPGSIEVVLYADGEETDQTLTIREADKWTGTFNDLDKYKDKKEIKYTVREKSVKGYESVIKGDAKMGYTVTNSHNAAPVKGTKTGDDSMMVLYMIIMLAAMAGAVAVLTVRSRNRTN